MRFIFAVSRTLTRVDTFSVEADTVLKAKARLEEHVNDKFPNAENEGIECLKVGEEDFSTSTVQDPDCGVFDGEMLHFGERKDDGSCSNCGEVL